MGRCETWPFRCQSRRSRGAGYYQTDKNAATPLSTLPPHRKTVKFRGLHRKTEVEVERALV